MTKTHKKVEAKTRQKKTKTQKKNATINLYAYFRKARRILLIKTKTKENEQIIDERCKISGGEYCTGIKIKSNFSLRRDIAFQLPACVYLFFLSSG